MPCNLNQRELAQHVKRGIREAGGTPMEFNTIAVSDGVSMGTEGMRASLVSREVIADSIELVARGHLFDGLVCLVGCDKTIPAAVMALGAARHPRPRALQRLDRARACSAARDVTIQDVFEAIGAHAAGTMSGAEAARSSRASPAPAPAPAAASSPRTRCRRSLEFLGISAGRAERDPGAGPEQGGGGRTWPAGSRCGSSATTSGRRRSSRARRSRTPPRRSPPPAARRTACCTCSRSRASSGSRSRSTTSTRIAARTPVVADLKPGGRFVATDMYAAGGVALVARELLKRDDSLTGSALNVDGRTLGADRGGGRGDPRAGGRRPDRDAAEGDRRPARSCTATSRRTARS